MELESLHLGPGPEKNRQDFFKLVDSCRTDAEVEHLIREVAKLEGDELERALPALSDFAEKCPPKLGPQLEELLLQVLAAENSTRAARKASLSAVKVLKGGDSRLWNDFFVVAESFEEPQFHIIRPMLPRVDELLAAVSRNDFPWPWTASLLVRALLHSNGWIRLWALEKFLDVDTAILAQNTQFLFKWILPALNGNDLLWRLQERDHLEDFIDRLRGIFDQLVQKVQNQELFLRDVFASVELLSCPVAFFYVARALGSIKATGLLGGEDVFPIFRRVLKRVFYIPHSSLRLVTCYLFVDLMAKITRWDEEKMRDFGSLTAFFSSEAPELYGKVMEKAAESWRSTGIKLGAEDFVAELAGNCSKEGDYCRVFWKRAELAGLTADLVAELERALEGPTGALAIECLMEQYLNSFEVQETASWDRIYTFIRRQFAEPNPDLGKIERLYLPFVQRFRPQFVQDLLDDVKDEITTMMPTARLAAVTLLKAKRGTVSDGSDLLETPKSDRTGLTTKEFTTLLGKIQKARIDMYLRVIDVSTRTACQDVEDCISQLDCASSFPVKDALLAVISARISEVTDSDLLLRAVNAAAAIVNEEKKSQNCLPAIGRLFGLLFQPCLLQNAAIVVRTKQLFEEFAQAAQLSHAVSLLLANVLQTAEEHLTPDWAKQLLQIAVFGPVPKKDNRVAGQAFDWIYGHFGAELTDYEFEKVHELIQRARMRAFSVAVRCSRRDRAFAAALVRELIEESTQLDKSSSKSFGLSLAHRQKTRVVALLLFVMEYIPPEDEETLTAVFEHSLTCILDPCQQFSIKLLVEWLLIRLCIKSPNWRERLIAEEKTLASQRIGSISSWINMMVHLCRATESTETRERLIAALLPWTTAQNFAVRCSAIAGLKLIYASLSPALQQAYKYVETIVNFDAEPAGNSRRIIDNLTGDFYFAHLDMASHLDLQTVLVELPTKTGLPAEETIPIRLIQELNRTQFRSCNPDSSFLAAPSLVYAALLKNASCAPDIGASEEEEADIGPPEQSSSLQKKIITKERVRPADSSLIVVASLIDKPNNLGGLCRTSEIFGVDRLVIADLLMAQDQGFKALSMSSEKWQKMEAVRPDSLLPYLEALRAEGYTVIAAEQTTDSIPFQRLSFPKKCVLLMGEEKAGVPTRLLRAVDRTAEIEQLGHTRSLNVHVTAALFIAKYAEQILI